MDITTLNHSKESLTKEIYEMEIEINVLIEQMKDLASTEVWRFDESYISLRGCYHFYYRDNKDLSLSYIKYENDEKGSIRFGWGGWSFTGMTVDGAKMAFWISHSRAFPSYHFGTVSSLEIDIKGHRRVTCNEYGFALFKPIFIIPKAVGLIIAEKIKGIEAEYDADIEEAEDKAKASISEINAWIKTFDEPTGEISGVTHDE